MRRLLDTLQSNRRLAVILAALSMVAAIPLFSCAEARPTTAITITNSSSWEIKHVYFSAPNQDNWGPDQLNGSSLAPGQSVTLNDVACDGNGVKVISEDQNGCFLSTVVGCASNSNWNITNNATPDCGS